MLDYRNYVIVIDHENKQITLDAWQEIYGLEVGSNKIGKYFSCLEWRFKQDIEDYGQLVIYTPLIILMDAYREISGKPCRVAAFNRDEKKQEDLRRRGFKAAKYSPHVWKMAADIDLNTEEEVRKAVVDMREASRNSGVECRIGWEHYLPNQTFIHVDVCPMYFAQGKPRHEEFHPDVWETPKEW